MPFLGCGWSNVHWNVDRHVLFRMEDAPAARAGRSGGSEPKVHEPLSLALLGRRHPQAFTSVWEVLRRIPEHNRPSWR